MKKNIGSRLPDKWFLDRVGQHIMANSSSYNGMMLITDNEHALYLSNVSQRYFGFYFSELKQQPFQNQKT